jgi:hypothetical protein
LITRAPYSRDNKKNNGINIYNVNQKTEKDMRSRSYQQYNGGSHLLPSRASTSLWPFAFRFEHDTRRSEIYSTRGEVDE